MEKKKYNFYRVKNAIGMLALILSACYSNYIGYAPEHFVRLIAIGTVLFIAIFFLLRGIGMVKHAQKKDQRALSIDILILGAGIFGLVALSRLSDIFSSLF